MKRTPIDWMLVFLFAVLANAPFVLAAMVFYPQQGGWVFVGFAASVLVVSVVCIIRASIALRRLKRGDF